MDVLAQASEQATAEFRAPSLFEASESDKANGVGHSLKMLCDTHKAPAVFFSQNEQKYICFKCIVAQEKLLYIDGNYTKELQDFERIKALTEEAIKSNMKNTKLMKQWKYDIRASLMKVKSTFCKQIDNFRGIF